MEKIQLFLNKYRMNYQSIDMEKECQKLIQEMEAGLEGRDSSLEMIPTYLTVTDQIKQKMKAIVIDAGGTNFRVGLVEFDEEMTARISEFSKYQMPGIEKELSKQAFFETMVDYTKPVANKGTDIGFCFSYPVEINKEKDGILLRWSKEVKAPEVIGEKIGANLVEGLRVLDNKERKVVILNDTVATLLGGKGITSHRQFDGYIGFIFGTGTNACYIEKQDKIKKLHGLDPKGTMIINGETGNYDKLPRGILDEAFDQTTNNPGDYQFEKMVSGRYLGPIVLRVLQAAVAERLFSHRCGEILLQMTETTLIEVNEFMYDAYNEKNTFVKAVQTEEDRMVMYSLIDAMIERAAKLCAIKLSSMVLKTGAGKNPCKPVAIVAEGTTFYKLKGYEEKLHSYMRDYLMKQKGHYYEFLQGENLNLIGTAIAALSNN